MNKQQATILALSIATVALLIWLFRRGKIFQLTEADEMKTTFIVNRAPRGIPGTRHFSLSEFHSKDGQPVPVQYYGNLSFLMDQLEVIRREAGGKPVRISSGYRSPAHNKKVGGASHSMHLRAAAADINIDGLTPPQVQKLVGDLMAAGKIHKGGLGKYRTFTHYDIGKHRFW